jgi:hypothetical protein
MVKRAPEHLQDIRPVGERQLGNIVDQQLQHRHERCRGFTRTVVVVVVTVRAVTHRPRLVHRPQQRPTDRALLDRGRARAGMQTHRRQCVCRDRWKLRRNVDRARRRGVHACDPMTGSQPCSAHS